MPRPKVLMAIRPRFADKIFSGEKTIELRRRIPDLIPGDRVQVYVSAPVCAIAGEFVVAGVISDVPNNLWKEARKKAAVTKDEFDIYFAGARLGHGILVESSRRMTRPVTLKRLRDETPDFHPPQSYCYLRVPNARNKKSKIDRLSSAGDYSDKRVAI